MDAGKGRRSSSQGVTLGGPGRKPPLTGCFAALSSSQGWHANIHRLRCDRMLRGNFGGGAGHQVTAGSARQTFLIMKTVLLATTLASGAAQAGSSPGSAPGGGLPGTRPVPILNALGDSTAA